MGGDFLEKDARYSFEERATLQSLLESEAIARVGHVTTVFCFCCALCVEIHLSIFFLFCRR